MDHGDGSEGRSFHKPLEKPRSRAEAGRDANLPRVVRICLSVEVGMAVETIPPSSRAEGLLFLYGLESNPGSSLQTEEAEVVKR